MTMPRQPRPRPVPMTPEEKAELEEQFRLLHERLNAYPAREAVSETHTP
jgi:hypothetical protein